MERLARKIPPELEPLLGSHTPEQLWKARSFIQRNWSNRAGAPVLLALTRDYYEYSTQIRASVTAADFSRLARSLEMGRDIRDYKKSFDSSITKLLFIR